MIRENKCYKDMKQNASTYAICTTTVENELLQKLKIEFLYYPTSGHMPPKK
jgi:hypothetical protein